jgi:hypothetical protein
MNNSQKRALRFLPLFLLSLPLAAQITPASQNTPIPYASANQVNTLLGNLEQASQAALADLAKVRVDRWKADSGTKRQSESDVESLARNLQSALPTMIGELRASPEDLAATFKLYHNLDALHDVFRSVAESAGAFGSRSEYQSLANDSDTIDNVRRALADRLQNLASAKESELSRLRAQVKAAQAAPPSPPKKIVVDDTETKKPAKKKPAPKPSTQSQPKPPAQTQPQQPSTPK